MTKQEQLLDALSDVDAGYIEDAFAPPNRRRSPLGALLGLAACLVLLAAGAGMLLGRRQTAPEPEPAQPAENADATSERLPQDESGKSDEPADETLREGDAAVNAARDVLLRYRIGKLYLGMPQSEVQALLGAPDDVSNSGPVQFKDGRMRINWFYRRADESQRSYVSIGFATDDDGVFVVNQIDVWDNSLELPQGIRIGMTEAELLAAWPALTETFFASEDGLSPQAGQPAYKSYWQYAGDDLLFSICLEGQPEDLRVWAVSLGSFFPEPPLEEEVLPELPYDFASSEITLWRCVGGVWRATELQGQAAKPVEVQFGIEELGANTCATGVPQYLVDFHNGTVAAVFDAAESGCVCRLEDREAFASGLAAGSVDPDALGLRVVQYAVFPLGVWDLLTGLSGG